MQNKHMSTAFFHETGEGSYRPSEAVIGPWSRELQHGGPPCALLTSALRRFPGSGNQRLARLTVEFFGPVPVQPCEIRVESVRGGRNIELLRGHYIVDGKTVLQAQAWRLRSEDGLSESVADPYTVAELPGPQTQELFPGLDYFPYGAAMEWRFVAGGFGRPGPATVWTRPRIPLIEGREPEALESLILMVDSANGVSAELDLREWTFVPVDMSVGILRQPVGEWLGMDARTAIGRDGTGQTITTLFDTEGPVGHSIHTLFVSRNR